MSLEGLKVAKSSEKVAKLVTLIAVKGAGFITRQHESITAKPNAAQQ